MQNAILKPAFNGEILIGILHDEILNRPKKIPELVCITGGEEYPHHPRIVKAEVQLLVIFCAYYQEFAKMLM
jgi:hypothetical protein